MKNETLLTDLLVQNLANGQIKKITRNNKGKVQLRREVGNNSFRSDIFITLEKDREITRHDISGRGISFIAIEVKIKDWKQGLYQAWRYNSFAEKSYLAIYEQYAKNIDLNLFEEHNVGLIIFNENSIVIKNHPKKNNFRDTDHYSKDLREKILSSLPAMKSVQPVV